MIMDEPHVHGIYISPGQIALLTTTAIRQPLLLLELEQATATRDAMLKEKTDLCRYDPNGNVSVVTTELANHFDIEPYELNDILKFVIPKLALHNDHARKSLHELLIMAKLIEFESIEHNRKLIGEIIEQKTKENLQREAGSFRSINDMYTKRAAELHEKLVQGQSNLQAQKEWLVSKVNRTIGVTAGNYEVMSPTDRAVIETLRDEKMLVIDGPYILVNQYKLDYEMNDVELALLMQKVHDAVDAVMNPS